MANHHPKLAELAKRLANAKGDINHRSAGKHVSRTVQRALCSTPKDFWSIK
tara:strand:- start:7228 stop:7380 length:153 start_codon:yes stop_codon:yes gene_type:complete